MSQQGSKKTSAQLLPSLEAGELGSGHCGHTGGSQGMGYSLQQAAESALPPVPGRVQTKSPHSQKTAV